MSRSSLRVRTVRRVLADGTVKEYTYAIHPRSARKSNRLSADSVGSCLLEYRVSAKWSSLSAHTQRHYGYYLRHLDRAFAEQSITAITPVAVISLRDAIAKTHGNGAAAGFVVSAGAFFTWLIDTKRLSVSPMWQVHSPRGGELPAWTPEEARLAIAGLPETYRRVVLLALYTGQRRGDLCRMKWSDYDGATIHLRQEKTGEELYVPLPPEFRAELDQWKASSASSFVLTTTTGRPWTPKHLSIALPRCLKELGMRTHLNVHGLRKLAAAQLAEAGCTEHQIAAITGHKTLAMVSYYTKQARRRVLAQQAIAKMERVGEYRWLGGAGAAPGSSFVSTNDCGNENASAKTKVG